MLIVFWFSPVDEIVAVEIIIDPIPTHNVVTFAPFEA
jgi:hypothetical protein